MSALGRVEAPRFWSASHPPSAIETPQPNLPGLFEPSRAQRKRQYYGESEPTCVETMLAISVDLGSNLAEVAGPIEKISLTLRIITT